MLPEESVANDKLPFRAVRPAMERLIQASDHSFRTMSHVTLNGNLRFHVQNCILLLAAASSSYSSKGRRRKQTLERKINPAYLLVSFSVTVLVAGKCFDLPSNSNPTEGFTEVPLTEANFELQKPYDVPLEQRYSYVDGVRRFWVYADDKPHNIASMTQPRTEARILGLDYSSGVWQFEGYGFVPNGTSGATIAQIHGASHGATTLILRIYDGDMRYYSGDLIETGLYDRWFRLNVVHDVDGGEVTVFIDGEQKFQTADKGPGDLYFKCGVYAAPANIRYYMESRWRDIKIYKK